MTDQTAQTAYYHQLVEVLRDWNAGGTVCVFGAAIPEPIRSQFSFESITHISQREYDICNLYNLDRRWDIIVVNDVLERVLYPWIAVEEIRKHLKPHGMAVFIAHSANHVRNEPNNYWRFTTEGLRVLCVKYATTITGSLTDDSEGTGGLPITWAVARTSGASPELHLWQPPVEEHAVEGGPWQVDDFVETGGDQWVEKRVCDYVVSTFAPMTALDIGCGAGLFVSYLNHRTVDTWGIEAADLRSIFSLPEKFIQHDLRIPLNLQQQFDLVLCLEVAEHIDAAFEQVLFETIRRHSKRYLLFSAAILGQEGHGHINLHPEAYWFARLRTLGYHLLIDPTNICRALCVHPWYAKNISFWELTSDTINEGDQVVLSDFIDLPDAYVRRMEDDYLRQREYIDTLQQKHSVLTSSWEEQRQHIDALTMQYEQQRESWKEQRQHLIELEQHTLELGELIQRQQTYIANLEQRHAELQTSWEAQRSYIDDMEQKSAKLAEEWNAQHQYIEGLIQRHNNLLEESNKQRDYIDQQLHK